MTQRDSNEQLSWEIDAKYICGKNTGLITDKIWSSLFQYFLNCSICPCFGRRDIIGSTKYDVEQVRGRNRLL